MAEPLVAHCVPLTRGWLPTSIARNAVIDVERRRSVRPPQALGEGPGDPSLDEPIERAMQRWHVQEALARLKPEHRAVLDLVYEDSVARRIVAESRRRRARRVRRPLLAGFGGLAVGAAATLGIVAALGGFSGDTASAHAVDLAGTDSAPSAWGRADLESGPHGTTIRLEADGLPASKPGQHNEVWLSDGRRGITAGTFRVGRDGKARCTLATAGRAEQFRLVDVTVEQDAQPAAGDHPVVLLGGI